MGDVPECLRSVRNRIRSLFGFSPNREDKVQYYDVSGSELDLSSNSGGAISQLSGSPSPNKTETKRSNKKKTKGKSGLFGIKSKSRGSPKDRGKEGYHASIEETTATVGKCTDPPKNESGNSNAKGEKASSLNSDEFSNPSNKNTKAELLQSKLNTGIRQRKPVISRDYIKEINKIEFNRPITNCKPQDELSQNNAHTDNCAGTKSKEQMSDGNEVKESIKDSKSEKNGKGNKVNILPLPWGHGKPNDEVFVFTGSDTNKGRSPKTPSKAKTEARSQQCQCEKTTREKMCQCELVVYPCKCVEADDGRKVVCSSCVDRAVGPTDRILIARSREINSVSTSKPNTPKASSKTAGKEKQTCSSNTQTSALSQESKQKMKAITPKKGQVTKESAKPSSNHETNGKSTQGSSGGLGSNNTPKIASNGTAARDKVKQDVTKNINNWNEAKPGVATTGAVPPDSSSTNSKGTPNKIDKLKNIWKQIKGATEKPFTDACGNLVFELPHDFQNPSDPTAELFLAATTEDLDRIDGITRGKCRVEKKALSEGISLDSPPPPVKQSPQSGDQGQGSDKKNRRLKSRRLPPKPTDDAESDKTLTPSQDDMSLTNTSLDGSFSASESKIKRALSLEELPSTPQDTPPKPFEKKVTFEYENPFEIRGCIRIDDHYDPGMKAGRGHIPEVKVKQKRRGEPNKHLSTHHRQSESKNVTDQVDDSTSDNRGGDPGLQIIDDLEKCSIPPENLANVDTVKDSSEIEMAGGEILGTSETQADTRHCDKIPLEVFYGKKGGVREEDEYQSKSPKKKKGRQRKRDSKGSGVVLVGLNIQNYNR